MASSSTPTACRFSGCCTQVVRSLLFLGEYDLVIGPRAYADRKSTRLNSSHGYISYAVFCLKKKKTTEPTTLPPLHLGDPIPSHQPPPRLFLSAIIASNVALIYVTGRLVCNAH